jgi:hypothetical protein
MWAKNWVIFAKKPFGNSKSVVEYLGRYTHKIAISNRRIVAVNEQSTTFVYKDYRQGGIKKTMTLSHEEFIRRFALHILPKGFVKIRHYGFLSSTWKREKLKALQLKLLVVLPQKQEKGQAYRKCSCCKTGNLHTIAIFDSRGPPACYIGISQNTFPCSAN